ncbi:MAG: ABC transporter permease [Truepera sp.]|nr:ABC transporter permease [Truepera sp.]
MTLTRKIKLEESMTRNWQLYRAEAYYQLLQQLRVPLQFFLIPLGVLLPYVALVLLSEWVLQTQSEPLLLVLFGTLGTFNLGLMGVGLATAQERAQGWMRLKRASPMPPLAHFVGKITVTLVTAALFALALLLIAAWAGHLPATIGEVARVFVLIILGALAFCALGLALAYAGGPNTAQSLIPQVILVLLALALLPAFDVLPSALQAPVQTLNMVSPVYHFAVLTFGFTGLPGLQGGPAWLHALALVGLTVLFTVLAIYLYRRDEGRTYG